MARDVDLEGQLRVLGMECCQAGRRRVGVQRERGVAMYCGLFGRTLDRSKHMVLADVPVRSLTASHEVRLDSQRNRTCINPVSHLRGRQDVVDAATARRQLASCHEHADQRGARLSPDVNGTAHCGPLVPLPCAAHSSTKSGELSHSFPWVKLADGIACASPTVAYCLPLGNGKNHGKNPHDIYNLSSTRAYMARSGKGRAKGAAARRRDSPSATAAATAERPAPPDEQTAAGP